MEGTMTVNLGGIFTVPPFVIVKYKLYVPFHKKIVNLNKAYAIELILFQSQIIYLPGKVFLLHPILNSL